MRVCALVLLYVSAVYGTRVILVENAPTCFRRVLAGRRALRSYVRRVYDCDTLEDCRRECATEKRFHCESFNYKLSPSYRGKGLCELMTQPIEAFDIRRDFVEDKNYDFYEVDRNSLEPNCPETLTGPGMLHSGFLSSNTHREGWRDRNWQGDRFFNQRDQRRRYEDRFFVPYQIGVSSRSDNSDNWGKYGGNYGGNQYYKNRNDYHKSITHWGIISEPTPKTIFKDFDYNSLGRHFERDLSGEIIPHLQEHDFPGFVEKTRHGPESEFPGFTNTGKSRYGYGSWKRGRWNSSGLNALDHDAPKVLEAVDRNDVVDEKECFARRRPGMSLGSGAIRRALLVRNVVDCEEACFSEIEFKCVSYSYRYSNSRDSDNCFLSERPYRGLELSTDSGSDVYAMQQCSGRRPWVESECFWHVRSDTAVSGSAVKATLTVAGLGACEAECIRASGFFCRGFSFRFDSPSIGDEDLHNCILTSHPPTRLDGNSRIATGHELYSRGNYGRGCEPATYDDVRENGECYLQYDKAAKLTPSATHAQLHAKSEQACGNACTKAPFKCLSFSYNNNAPPHEDNCFLSEIRLFDLQRSVDYVHSKDDWLFAFDVFNSRCSRRHHDDSSSEIPDKIHMSSEEDTFPGTGPSGTTGFSDSPDIFSSGPPTGPTGSGSSGLSGPSGPSGPTGPSSHKTGPTFDTSLETTGPFSPTPLYTPRPFPKEEHSPELPKPIQYRPRPRPDETYGPPDQIKPGFRPPEPESPRPFRPERPYRPEPDYKPVRPSEIDFRPGGHDRPNIRPNFGVIGSERPDFRPLEPNRPGGSEFKPPGFDRPGFRPGFGERPGFRPVQSGPGYLPGQKPGYGDREDPSQVSWRQYTVSGFPCRKGTSCAQNQVAGHWACEPEGGEIGSWDYCCAPTHRCGYSEGFNKPWCYVGSKEDQWRPCSEKYYPYHQHNVPHPSQAQGTGKREDHHSHRPWRETHPSYIPHWDKRPGPYLSEADKRYWDELYENGPKAYYDKYGNPLPGYSRVPTEGRPYIKVRPSAARPPSSGHWVPVSHDRYDREPPVPGLGAPRYWPVAYLHKSPPPNMTYFRYNETYQTTTEKHEHLKGRHENPPRRHENPTDRHKNPTNEIPEARNMDQDLPDLPEPDSKTERTNNKPSIFEKQPRRDDKKINTTQEENTTTAKVINKTIEVTTEKETVTSTEDAETQKTENYKEIEGIKGIDDKLGDFSKSIEVLDIEDAKTGELEDLKTFEAEERQIEAIGRLLASRRGSKLIVEKRSQKELEAKSIAVDKDMLDFDFGNKFPTEKSARENRPERRGTIKRISKAELEKDKNTDKSLELSETTYVRPPRVLSTTENIRKAIVNGKVFYDATIKDQKESNNTNSSRKPKNRRIDNTTPSLINNNNYGKKKNVRTRNVNPIRRVKRVYKKRYNPEEVRRRLLEREKSNHTEIRT